MTKAKDPSPNPTQSGFQMTSSRQHDAKMEINNNVEGTRAPNTADSFINFEKRTAAELPSSAQNLRDTFIRGDASPVLLLNSRSLLQGGNVFQNTPSFSQAQSRKIERLNTIKTRKPTLQTNNDGSAPLNSSTNLVRSQISIIGDADKDGFL